MKKFMSLFFCFFLTVSFLHCAGEDGSNGTSGIDGIDGVDGVQGDPGETEFPRLYVVGSASINISVFNNAGVAGWSYGNIFPDREIDVSDDVTPSGLSGIAFSNETTMFIAANNRIYNFRNADTADGYIEPYRTIISTQISSANGICVDGSDLFVGNGGSD